MMRQGFAILALMTLAAIVIGALCAFATAGGRPMRYAFYYSFAVVFGGAACVLIAFAIAMWGGLLR